MSNTRSRLAFVSAGLAAVALVLGGCAGGAKLTQVWKNPAWTAPPLTNVYVVAIRPDPIRRNMWEDGFVEGLARYGVRATPSHLKYMGMPPDTQQVIAEVKANGYDGVLVSSRLPDETAQTVVPGTSRTEMVTEQRSFTGEYYTTMREIEDPGRVDSSTVRSVRVDVWSSGRIVWSGTAWTDKFPSSDLVRKVASGQISDRLAKDGVLPKKK